MALVVSPDKIPQKTSNLTHCRSGNTTLSLANFNFWKQIAFENSALPVILDISWISEKFLRILVRMFGDHLILGKMSMKASEFI